MGDGEVSEDQAFQLKPKHRAAAGHAKGLRREGAQPVGEGQRAGRCGWTWGAGLPEAGGGQGSVWGGFGRGGLALTPGALQALSRGALRPGSDFV